MKYDFETLLDRRGKDALAIDAVGGMSGFAPSAPRDGFDLIPMWVADMNFPTAPSITEAIIKRAQHPLFGYFEPSEAYYDAVIKWQCERNGVKDLAKEHIGYDNGVLGGVLSALNVICSRGDKVLIHSPTYIGFTSSLKNNGYELVHSPLVKDDDGVWRMDFSDMERRIRDGNIHAAVFCSPHNPCGRVWEYWELEKAMHIFQKYDVFVICDEIWSDLLLDGNKHIPVQSVNEYARQRTVSLYAPSKTFNLAGLTGSYRIVYNKLLRDRINKESSLSHYNNMNVMSMHALIGAYSSQGAEWLEELLAVLSANARDACDYIDKHFRGVNISRPQGTYMLFADCSRWCAEHGRTIDELEQACWDVGAAVQDGRMFNGECHIRINLALPNFVVKEAMRRLDRYVFNA